MTKYKVIFDRANCIGTFACITENPDHWVVGEDGKSILEGSVLNEKTGYYELIIEEKDLEKNKDAAAVCPVFVISIEKIEELSANK